MKDIRGRLHLYTGEGKGKTSAAVGMAIRTIGAGMKVAFLQFDKGYDGGDDIYNERKVLRSLNGLYLFASGLSRFNEDGGFRSGITVEDKIEASVGLEKAAQVIACGKYDMVILDEAITVANYGLVEKDDVMNVIHLWENEGRPCELVLTGRGAWQELMDAADLVSEIVNVKHYFDKGHSARRGVEY